MKSIRLIKSGDIALALTLIATLVAISPSWADCQLKDLKGSYGYSEQGVVIQGTTQTFISEAGILMADGQGHFTAKSSAIWAPLQLPPPYQQPLTLVFTTTNLGEGYTVNPNCTGDATFSTTVTDVNGLAVPVGPNGSNVIPDRSFHFVLDSSKHELKYVSTTPGTVATGVATAQ